MLKFILIFLSSSYSIISYADPALEALGERLFNDHRFSKEFHDLSGGDINATLTIGSPSLIGTAFEGSTYSCATCHSLDHDLAGMGMRGYNDNRQKTPIPFRQYDQKNKTLRNTPSLIEINSKYYPHSFVHHDGEVTLAQTVLGNMTGRNMGWLASEKEQAIDKLVKVIRKDNGSLPLSQDFGGSYEKIFLGIDPSIPEELRLTPENRLDLQIADNGQIQNLVIKAVVKYMSEIQLEKDDHGAFVGSLYDQFLKLNGIATIPAPGQSLNDYLVELRQGISDLKNPRFIKPTRLETHDRSFKFGMHELQGLKIFLNLPNHHQAQGMCLNCHTPPLFSNGDFHNIGVSQKEYESIHGDGSFQRLTIPSLLNRGSRQSYLGLFAATPRKEDHRMVDLGAWNTFGAKGLEQQTQFFRKLYCPDLNQCDDEAISELLVGAMKTPMLRNLGHSGPYFHNGSAQTLEEVVEFYVDFSIKARNGELRNIDRRMRKVKLTRRDIRPIADFLKTLNEEYE